MWNYLGNFYLYIIIHLEGWCFCLLPLWNYISCSYDCINSLVAHSYNRRNFATFTCISYLLITFLHMVITKMSLIQVQKIVLALNYWRSLEMKPVWKRSRTPVHSSWNDCMTMDSMCNDYISHISPYPHKFTDRYCVVLSLVEFGII